jgi:4-hydroxybenzoate polyprenyltransferase
MAKMRFSGVGQFLELIKFSHTLFALPFALLGAALAAHDQDGWHGRVWDWVGILICMATARSAAMAFNRLSDRHFDAENPRTASRHLPAGLLCYSYTKRFTSLAHFWLGISLSLAPIAAWIALRGDMGWPPVMLSLAVLLWVAGFDIIYACQDVEFDRSSGLRSVPKTFGVPRALQIAAACHALMILPLVGLGVVYPLGPIYFVGVAAVAALLVYEHALVRPDDLTRVNVAFFQVNVVISTGLLVVVVVDLLV